MTASLLSAIRSLSKVEMGQELETISMSDSQFYFAQKREFNFFLIDDKNSSRTKEQAKILLESLSERFFKEYPDAAGMWRGDLSVFEGFGPACDEVVQVQPTRKGFPALLRIVLEPYLVTPVTQLLPLSGEKEDAVDHLLASLLKETERASLKDLRRLFEKPHLVFLPGKHQIVFIYAFRQTSKSKDVSHLLCFLVAEDEWFTFYQLLPLFQKHALRVLPPLADFLQKLEKNPAAPEVKQQKSSMANALAEWADLNQYISKMQTSIFDEIMNSLTMIYKEKMSEKGLDNVVNAFDYTASDLAKSMFLKFLRASHDLDKIIFAILGQQQVLFVGEDQPLVEMVLSAFLTYYPHPSVKLWAEEPSECLLVGTHLSQVQNYPQGTVVLDLRASRVIGGYPSRVMGRVIGGEKNEFCAKLIENIKKFARGATVPESRAFFQGQVGALFALLHALLQDLFFEGPREHQQQFQDALKSFPEGTVRLVGQLSKKLHPLLAEKLLVYHVSSMIYG